jgi:tetratricopeptide (TPR) repeat protein
VKLITTLVLALATSLAVAPQAAYAGDPPPTAAELEKAKKAFMEGKKLHEAGKVEDAIEKYKESYKLSKKPALLYNIGIAMEEAGMDDLALMNFRRFLKEAPADAEQRPMVEERIKVIEKKLGIGGSGTPDTTKPDPKKPPEPKAPVVVKPAGTYGETDFQHQVVDTAPPGKPLDVTAFVPEDSGFTVTLFFRTAGEGKFSSKPMKWRYKELVARIPAPKMIGSAVQYYIDVKDQAGQAVAKSGKPTSPHQVLLEAGATARFYPDMSDDGEAKVTTKDVVTSDDDDDPLSKRKPKQTADLVLQPTEPTAPGTGFTDVGSSKFTKAKWGTTIAGGALIGFAAFSFVQALKYSGALEDDSQECGAPPCRPFTNPGMNDFYAADVEKSGKQWQSFFKIGLGVGIGVGVVAGYLWYKESKAKKRGEMKVSKSAKPPETSSSWIVVPAVDATTAGAAATLRF